MSSRPGRSLSRPPPGGLRELRVTSGDTAFCETLVAASPSLRHLDLQSNSDLTDEGLRHLLSLRELAFLDISQCYSLTAGCIDDLAKVAPLREVDLRFNGAWLRSEHARRLLEDRRGATWIFPDNVEQELGRTNSSR